MPIEEKEVRAERIRHHMHKMSEVEKQSLLTEIIAIEPDAQQVIADVQAFLTGPGPKDEADVVKLFNDVVSVFGPLFGKKAAS